MSESAPVCLLFAGQAIQHQGMCTELWRLPAARAILERLRPALGDDLERVSTEMPGSELAKTVNAQRAIHAHHLGHWFAYRAACPDVEPGGAIGHSVGVVAALVAAGALTVEDSATFMRARADAFSEACAAAGGGNGLAAVATEEYEGLVEVLEGFEGLSVCLRNTPSKVVIGGPIAALEAFAAEADREGWPVKAKVLDVEGAFHSHAFASCRARLEPVLAAITIAKPDVPVYMGTSGRRETEPERIRELLLAQPTEPELHQDAVVASYEDGCRSFLEIAARPEPSRWIREQLVDEDEVPLPGIVVRSVRTAEIGIDC